MIPSGRWVTLTSARGYPFRVWRQYRHRRMPLIDQGFLDSSIYLYDSKQSAQSGEKFGGSGCLVSVLSPPLMRTYDIPQPYRNHRRWTTYGADRVSLFPPHIYAVTNKHVARHSRNPFPVIRLNTIDGKTDILALTPDDWIPHPDGDDLAIAPIDFPPDNLDYFPIDSELFLTRENLYGGKPSDNFVVGAGDDTFMVGRFTNHAGEQRNTPSLRFGSVAMLPFEKVKLDKEANNHMQEAFLVETRSISGYSGSPVFVYQPSISEAEIPLPDDGYDYPTNWIASISDLMGSVRFLGIDCAHVRKYEKVINRMYVEHPNGWQVETNTGMAIVIPAWRLMTLLNKPELVMQRKEKDAKYGAKPEAEDDEETPRLDVEVPETFTKESYQDALRRASRKVADDSESDS